MTNEEFSNEFDVLYNNITSNQAPGLDEYEKSVFLTKALDLIVKDYFNPRTNKTQEGFDGNERRQIDFSMLLRSTSFSEKDSENDNSEKEDSGKTFLTPTFDQRKNTKAVKLPTDILMFVNEYVVVTRGSVTRNLVVVPINYMEYARLMNKPFKSPVKNLAWRLLDNSDSNNRAELIIGPNDILSKYVIRYVKRPNAIRLIDFTNEGLTIDGKTTEQKCELDPILHTEILQRAVELAKAAYVGDLNSQIALGTTSQTEQGMLTGGK